MFGLGVHAEYLFGVFHVHVVVDSIVVINVVVYMVVVTLYIVSVVSC